MLLCYCWYDKFIVCFDLLMACVWAQGILSEFIVLKNYTNDECWIILSGRDDRLEKACEKSCKKNHARNDVLWVETPQKLCFKYLLVWKISKKPWKKLRNNELTNWNQK